MDRHECELAIALYVLIMQCQENCGKLLPLPALDLQLLSLHIMENQPVYASKGMQIRPTGKFK